MVYCQLTLRPALFLRSSLARLVDQEIIELFPLDRCDEPTGSSAATCPSLARWTTIFECDFSPSHRAYTCPTQAIRFVASRFRSLVLNYYHVGKIARRQRSRYRSGRPVGALTIVGAG